MTHRTLEIMVLVLALPWTIASGGEQDRVEGVTPGSSWRSRMPKDVGLDRGKLQEFGRFVGGRGCVVRHGYLVYSWGDISRRADVASACKPFYSHLLLVALESGRIAGLEEKVVRWEPRLKTINAALITRTPRSPGGLCQPDVMLPVARTAGIGLRLQRLADGAVLGHSVLKGLRHILRIGR